MLKRIGYIVNYWVGTLVGKIINWGEDYFTHRYQGRYLSKEVIDREKNDKT
jgi:hypothetical protein